MNDRPHGERIDFWMELDGVVLCWNLGFMMQDRCV